MIFVLSGFSGVGKDTLMKDIRDCYNFKEIVSYTSRPIRENETNGIEYNFISKKEFLHKIDSGDFIEYRRYNTSLNSNKDVWYYGVDKDSIKDGDYIAVLDIKGYMALKKEFKVCGIFIDAPIELRKQRAIERGSFCQDEFDRRIQDDLSLYPVEIVQKEFDYMVTNINYDICLKQIKEIIGGLRKLF